MKYNFDEVIERRGTDSVKYDAVSERWEKIGASDFNDEFIRETFRYYVKSTTARYLKLVIPEGHGNACPPAAIRELTVFGY